MIRVYFSKQSNYPVKASIIKKQLRDYFQEKGIVSDADVSVSIVGEKQMIELARKYLEEEGVVHNVLSFPFTEGKTITYPPGDVIHLGDIVVCFPKAVNEANSEGKLVEKKVWELVEHGAMHLMGIHHE